MGDYNGPERRDSVKRETLLADAASRAFEEAVTTATKNATQEVAKVHRRRLVRHSFLAAMVAASVLGILSALVAVDISSHSAHNNAQYNCRILTEASGLMAWFVRSETHLRTAQANTAAGKKLILDFRRILPLKDFIAAEAQSGAEQTLALRAWETQIAPRLGALAKANCSTSIR